MDKKLRQLEEEQRRLAAEIDKTNENIEALKKERKEKIRSSVVGVGQVSGGSKKSYELSEREGWLYSANL